MFDDHVLDSLSLNGSSGTSPVSRLKKPGNGDRTLSFNALLASNQKLQNALEYEEIEAHRLEKLLRETRLKLDTSMIEQARLEEDVDARNKQIAALEAQVKQFKKAKHELETLYSQDQMKYINEKQQWLNAEAEYQTTVKHLNDRMAEKLDEPLKSPTLSIHSVNSGTFAPLVAPSPAMVPPSKPGVKPAKSTERALERTKAELEMVQQQMEMVTKEYTLRHEQIKQEMEELKSLNARLVEENEGFQILLAEKAILGRFSLAQEMENSGGEQEEQETEKGYEEVRDENTASDQPDCIDPELKRKLYDLEFEKQSLTNHNKALKLSLERLVHRLLEFKEFERVVEESQNIGQRSISAFQERVSQEERLSSPCGTPIFIPKRRMSSHTSSLYLSKSLTGFVPRSYRGGPLKNSQTWSSLLFSNSNTVRGNADTNSRIFSFGVDDSLSQITTSSNSTVGASSASSIESDEQKLDMPATVGLGVRRSATNGQNRLRPLRLISPSQSSSNTSKDGKDLTPPASAHSSWSFSFS